MELFKKTYSSGGNFLATASKIFLKENFLYFLLKKPALKKFLIFSQKKAKIPYIFS